MRWRAQPSDSQMRVTDFESANAEGFCWPFANNASAMWGTDINSLSDDLKVAYFAAI